VENFPQQAATISTSFPVANHSDSHLDFRNLSDARIRDELARAAAAIRSATVQDPRPLFRFPFGASDARTIGVVNQASYGGIRWTVDTLGWQGMSGGMTAQKVVDRVLANLQSGEIVLMHVGSNPQDGSTLDADAAGDRLRAAPARLRVRDDPPVRLTGASAGDPRQRRRARRVLAGCPALGRGRRRTRRGAPPTPGLTRRTANCPRPADSNRSPRPTSTVLVHIS